MIIQSNMAAMNALNQNKVNEKSFKKHSERLGSGYRINRAADDAAGLQISEKMRSQIRGLNQASDNLVDGISLVQIADGAMAEIQDMIHRMKELGVKASNGTLTDSDREAIQTETDSLIKEVDRIATSTEFNTLHLLDNTYNHGKTGRSSSLDKLLAGKITVKPNLGDVMTLGNGWVTTGNTSIGTNVTNGVTTQLSVPISLPGATPAGSTDSLSGSVLTRTTTLPSGNTQTQTWTYLSGTYGTASPAIARYTLTENDASGNTVNSVVELMAAGNGSPGNAAAPGTNLPAAYMDFSEFGKSYKRDDLIGTGFNTTCQTCNQHYSIYFVDNGGKGHKQSYSMGSNPVLEFDLGVLAKNATGADLVQEMMNAFSSPSSVMGRHYTQYAYDPADPSKLFVYDNRTWYTGTDAAGNLVSTAGRATFEPVAYGMPEIDPEIRFPIPIHCGPGQEQYFSFLLPWVTAGELGIDKIDMSTLEGARASLAVADKALDHVSTERSRMGAVQNRMEHALANVENTAENQQAAESRLRDANMANEIVQHSKFSILQQSAQAMISNANKNPEGILQLLS